MFWNPHYDKYNYLTTKMSIMCLPAGLLCRRCLIFDVRPSVRPCVRIFLEFHRRRHAPATLFLSAYTQCQISSCQKSIRKNWVFATKEPSTKKCFWKKLTKKSPSWIWTNLWFFHKLDSFTRCKIKKNLMFLAVWKLDHVTSTHLKN